MPEQIFPAELKQPLPRRVSIQPILLFAIVSFAVVGLFLEGLLMGLSYAQAYKAEILRARGVSATGTVISRKMYGSMAKTSYHVSYSFQPPAAASGKSPFHEEVATTANAYYHLHEGGPVDVIYDPLDPSRFEMNVYDDVRRTDPHKRLADMLWVSSFLACILIPMISYLYWLYWREKDLIREGHMTWAVILAEKEYVGRRGMQFLQTTYEFTDAEGRTVQGVRKNLSRRGDPSKQCRELTARILDNPVVLYNPKNSAKNMLYPGAFAICEKP
ncbi:MAG: DUF3592 domain-containing protein [Alphaproteobacteria bacterium]|nr:DUF3592 domain-containing protein [Alphaproteobacteria bacterium]